MQTQCNPTRAPSKAVPLGGYEPISVQQLAMAWWVYCEGFIRKLDLRVWFASWELEVRRRLSGGKYKPNVEDLQKLVGQGELRASLKRLEAIGLLRSWSKTGISFAQSPDEIKVEDRSGLEAMLDEFHSPHRKIPVPRRILRRLAGGMGRARTACVIAHLIRCLFYRKGEGCSSSGCCKASWIARVFGITERSVYDARRFLVEELGWLIPQESSQRQLNRDGLWVTIDLEWGPEERVGQTPAVSPAILEEQAAPVAATTTGEGGLTPSGETDGFSPPPAVFPAQFSGPEINKKPPTELKNQKPAEGGGGEPGFQTSHSEEKAPTLTNVVSEDLRDVGRLLELHEEAVEKKLITTSEADRLKFVAGAVHAQSASSKPTRLFAWMVWKGQWKFISQADEDEAISRLKRHFRPEIETPVAPPRPTFSRDALIVREIRDILRRRGIHVDPFAAASRSLPADWTRERWDRAVRELDGGSSQENPLASVLKGFGLN